MLGRARVEEILRKGEATELASDRLDDRVAKKHGCQVELARGLQVVVVGV